MMESPRVWATFIPPLRNVMLLNNALGFLLGGGAYSHSTETDSQGVVISGWLPLCNNGVRRLADQKAHCFMNIWLDKLTWLGSLSFFIVPGPKFVWPFGVWEGGKMMWKGRLQESWRFLWHSETFHFVQLGEVGFNVKVHWDMVGSISRAKSFFSRQHTSQQALSWNGQGLHDHPRT